MSAWDRCSADLVSRRSRFRLRRRTGRATVYVREIGPSGSVLREFSPGQYRVDDDEAVEKVYQLCLDAHGRGRWPDLIDGHAADQITWQTFASLVLEDVRQRIAKRSSRAHTEGHLRTIATWHGPVTAKRLERWAAELDPVGQAASFRKRLDTLGQIQTSGILDVAEVLERLRAMRPRGAARKRLAAATMRPRAIPTDQQLQDWLDGLQGMERWTFALIATYGLRPSEAWHVEGIDEKGWITVPGEGLTKTSRHYAPPVPAEWVARYCLREHFSQYQGQLLSRWPLRWEEIDGLRVPVNNSSVSNYLLKLQKARPQANGSVYPAQVNPLIAQACEGGGTDWVRPYDLRHSYAIRCFTDPAVNMVPSEDHASWLGHSLDVHERIYLRWMPAARQKQALQERHARLASGAQEPQEDARDPIGDQSDILQPTGPSQALPADVLAKLAKLEQLEKLLMG